MKSKILTIIVLIFIIFLIYNINQKEINLQESKIQIKEEQKVLTIGSPEFWIEKAFNCDELIMNRGEIEKFNQENLKCSNSLEDLNNYKEVLTNDELIDMINYSSRIPEEKRYDGEGSELQESDYARLMSNLNRDGIPKEITVKYGITCNRTMIRTFPTYEPSYKKPGDIQFDRFFETAIYPCEPLLIFWESQDGEWYFGRMYNYTGWIPKKDIALGEKYEIFKYVNKGPFLIVTERQIPIENILFDMGVKIPYEKEYKDFYEIILPKRDEEGVVYFKKIKINKSIGFHKGYLPYTKSNIIEQAFKFRGEKYGWGGMNNTRDCSAFVMDIHRTFGIKLPRNTKEQEIDSLGIKYDFTGKSLDERINMLKNVSPGTFLYMPGHAMLYLGEYNGKYYIMHQFTGYYEKIENSLEYKEVMKTDVTTLSIKTSSDSTFMEKINCAKMFY